MTVDQIDLGLTRIAQTIQTARNSYEAGVASITKANNLLSGLPSGEAALIAEIQGLAAGEGLNDDRKAILAEYTAIFQALRTPITTTAGNLESIIGL